MHVTAKHRHPDCHRRRLRQPGHLHQSDHRCLHHRRHQWQHHPRRDCRDLHHRREPKWRNRLRRSARRRLQSKHSARPYSISPSRRTSLTGSGSTAEPPGSADILSARARSAVKARGKPRLARDLESKASTLEARHRALTGKGSPSKSARPAPRPFLKCGCALTPPRPLGRLPVTSEFARRAALRLHG